jgi:hypothetical protein
MPIVAAAIGSERPGLGWASVRAAPADLGPKQQRSAQAMPVMANISLLAVNQVAVSHFFVEIY